jgi:hypothetical protein
MTVIMTWVLVSVQLKLEGWTVREPPPEPGVGVGVDIGVAAPPVLVNDA